MHNHKGIWSPERRAVKVESALVSGMVLFAFLYIVAAVIYVVGR